MRGIGRYLRAPATLTLIALIAVCFVAQRLSGPWLGEITHLERALSYDRRLVAGGQWWRVLTAELLNGPTPYSWLQPHIKVAPWDIVGFPHLFGNVVGLAVVGPYVERRLGVLRYLIVAAVGGAIAFGWLIVPYSDLGLGVDGTSGTVFALGGALLVLALRERPKRAVEWLGLAVLGAAGVVLIVGKPLATKEIHLGGLVGGAVLAPVVVRAHTRRSAMVAAVGTTVLLCGVMALRSVQVGATDARVAGVLETGAFPTTVAVADDGADVPVVAAAQVIEFGTQPWRAAIAHNPTFLYVAPDRSIWVLSVPRPRRAGPLQAVVAHISADGRSALIFPAPRGAAAVGRSTVWIAIRDGRLAKIDAATGKLSDLVPIGTLSYSAIVADGGVWLPDATGSSIVRVDERSLAVTRVEIGTTSTAVAVSAAADSLVWFAGQRELVGIDPRTERVTARVQIGLPAGLSGDYPDGTLTAGLVQFPGRNTSERYGTDSCAMPKLLALARQRRRMPDRARLRDVTPFTALAAPRDTAIRDR